MKFLYAGGECKNHCFANYGGCLVHTPKTTEILSSEEIAYQLGLLTSKHEQAFVYTPDMFSDLYYKSVFLELPFYDGGFPGAYIAVNASVRTLIDKVKDFSDLLDRGIREVWFGIESGDELMRKKYGKPNFSNSEVAFTTKELQRFGIHACWYLLDSKDDTDSSRLATYELIRECEPYRIRIWPLEDLEDLSDSETKT